MSTNSSFHNHYHQVTVREQGSCHRFGMIALEDLDEGETVFKIPRNILLEPNTSSLSETVLEFAKNLPEIDTRYFHVKVAC